MRLGSRGVPISNDISLDRSDASAVLAIAIPSVCLSVRLSVTRRCCVKTTARSTVLFALSDCKMCLVLEKLKNIPQERPLLPEILLQTDLPPPDSSDRVLTRFAL